jgi:flagellar hook-length control protein FliK
MPAVTVASTPVAVVSKGPTNGPGGAAASATNAADTESGNPFAAVLGRQMNGAAANAGDAGNAGTQADAPAAADSAAEPLTEDLAALLPMLFGTLGIASGPQTSGEESSEDPALGQAELALAMLAPPLASAANSEGAALATRGRAAAMEAVAGRSGERTLPQAGTADPAAIVAAAEEGVHGAADAPKAAGLTRADATALAVAAAADKVRQDVRQSDAALEIGGLGPDRALPEQAMVPMQAAAASRHADAASTYHVTPSVGTRQWESAVGDSLVFMAGQQKSSAEIVLTPPQLGRIEISLTVNANNEATATFVSASPAVQEALTNAVPRLKEILADAGITLSQADVNAGSPEQSPGGNGESPRRPATADFGGEAGARAVAVGNWSSVGHGLVDVFA